MLFGSLSVMPVVWGHFLITFSVRHRIALFLAPLMLWSIGVSPVYNTGIPTLCAGFAWAALTSGSMFQKRLVLIGFPLFASLVFILHPATAGAWVYTLYWLVLPVSGAAFSQKIQGHPLFCALTTSLIAHSIGTLMYLFFMPSSPAFWVALVPRIFFERIRIAGAMFLVDCIVGFARYTTGLILQGFYKQSAPACATIKEL